MTIYIRDGRCCMQCADTGARIAVTLAYMHIWLSVGGAVECHRNHTQQQQPQITPVVTPAPRKVASSRNHSLASWWRRMEIMLSHRLCVYRKSGLCHNILQPQLKTVACAPRFTESEDRYVFGCFIILFIFIGPLRRHSICIAQASISVSP